MHESYDSYRAGKYDERGATARVLTDMHRSASQDERVVIEKVARKLNLTSATYTEVRFSA